jgi:hypothetical protein
MVDETCDPEIRGTSIARLKSPRMPFVRRSTGITWSTGAIAALAITATVVSACGSNQLTDGANNGIGFDAGTADSCARPNQGCPCPGDGQQTACGQVESQNDGYVTCSEGTRTCQGGTWGPCVAQYNTMKSTGPLGGDIHTMGLGGPQTGDAGACVDDPCDPQCVTYAGDNSNGIDAGVGLVPTDGGWTLAVEGGTGCYGLWCQVPICGGGQTTTMTGTVYDPAALNPVFNAIVMIPNGPVQPIPAGVSMDPCGGAPLPPALTYAYSNTTGKFTLTNVPVGTSIPLVIQIGRWRRTTTINTSSLTCGGTLNVSATGCTGLNNYAGTAGCPTRLPRTQSEGNIPHTAIGTGSADAIECMLYRIGVSSSEYTDELNAGRIHIFHDGGSQLAAPYVNHDLSYLLGFGCDQANCQPIESTQGITNPDFETGDLTGWTTTGPVSASTAQHFSGAYSALLGSSATNTGTSTLSQTFTAPAGATALDFDIFPRCSQASSVNYFNAALKDNSNGSSIAWANSCTDNLAWVAYTAGGITPGDSYTLTVTSVDNDANYNRTYVDDLDWTLAQPPNLANNYDLIMLPCDGGGEYGAGNWGGDPYDDPGRRNLVNYAGAGGRVFTSHWGREWIERSNANFAGGPFPNVATWITSQQPCKTCATGDTGVINYTAAWGANFDAWMQNVGAGTAAHTFPINPWRYDTSSVSAASRLFVSYQSNGYPADFTFDTPLGGAAAGRVMFTDMHLANGTPSGTFPANCPTQGTALTQQEDAAEYLLFDLSGCVSGSPVPVPPQYNPATFDRDFQGVCPSGSRVVWRFFYWEDYTPKDSSIVFTAYTADTQAQLGTQYPGVALATASGPDNCPNGPSCVSQFVGVDVDPALVAGGIPTWGNPAHASYSWLRVDMALKPSSDLFSAPTLIAWQLTYDCVPSE